VTTPSVTAHLPQGEKACRRHTPPDMPRSIQAHSLQHVDSASLLKTRASCPVAVTYHMANTCALVKPVQLCTTALRVTAPPPRITQSNFVSATRQFTRLP
jgi:hypothetical protein